LFVQVVYILLNTNAVQVCSKVAYVGQLKTKVENHDLK